MTSLRSALSERRRGFSLPQDFYACEDIFATELEGVFANDWLFACNICEIRRPGDFLTLEVGRESVIVLCDRDAEVRAFFNTCRHRGSRICLTEKGNTQRLVCPYHQMSTLVDFALPADAARDPVSRELMERSASRWDGHGLPHLPAQGGIEFRCIRLPFKAGRVSFTPDGTAACAKLLGDFTDPDLGSARMFRAPNNWHHFLSDHIIHFRLLPLSAHRTALRTTWLVHEDAVEGVDYDLERLTGVWKATNDQDRTLAENNNRGILSRAYAPGPYSPAEFLLNDFTDWYVEKMTTLAAAQRE